jgi:hypothetical protein
MANVLMSQAWKLSQGIPNIHKTYDIIRKWVKIKSNHAQEII